MMMMWLRCDVWIIYYEKFAGFENEAFVEATPTAGNALPETRSEETGNSLYG